MECTLNLYQKHQAQGPLEAWEASSKGQGHQSPHILTSHSLFPWQNGNPPMGTAKTFMGHQSPMNRRWQFASHAQGH